VQGKTNAKLEDANLNGWNSPADTSQMSKCRLEEYAARNHDARKRNVWCGICLTKGALCVHSNERLRVPSSYLWINVWLDTCALTEHLPQPRIDDKCCAVRLVRRSARLLLPDLGWEAPKIKVVVDPVQEELPRPRRRRARFPWVGARPVGEPWPPTASGVWTAPPPLLTTEYTPESGRLGLSPPGGS